MTVKVTLKEKLNTKLVDSLGYLPPVVLTTPYEIDLLTQYRFFLGDNCEKDFRSVNTDLSTDPVVKSFLRTQNQTLTWQRVTQFWETTVTGLIQRLPMNESREDKIQSFFVTLMNQLYIMYENEDYRMSDSTDQMYGQSQLLSTRRQLLERALSNSLSLMTGKHQDSSLCTEGINKPLDLNAELDDEFDPFEDF